MRGIAFRLSPLVLFIFIGLVADTIAGAQSLGDLARENREKQKAKAAVSTSKPKVITDDNLPASGGGTVQQSQAKVAPSAPRPLSRRGQSAEEWRTLILAQKNVIANQQDQIDKLKGSVHFVNASVYTNGLKHNEQQAKKQETLVQMQRRLEEQRTKLANMQETARRAGMGSSVYEP